MTVLNGLYSLGTIARYEGKEVIIVDSYDNKYSVMVIEDFKNNCISTFVNVIENKLEILKHNSLVEFYVNKITKLKNDIISIEKEIKEMSQFKNVDHDTLSPDEIESLGYYYDMVYEGKGGEELESKLEQQILSINKKFISDWENK